MDSIKITENKNEMMEIGKQIVRDHPDIYTPLMVDKIKERIIAEFPKLDDLSLDKFLYCSIYDYWVYGNNIDEEFYYEFYKKSHAEKSEYMTNRIRNIYMDKICCGNERVDSDTRQNIIDQLEMKYKCYKLLEPYYKREIIEINDENDFPLFSDFASRHREFVVKPSDFCYGIGVHKVLLSDYSDVNDAFTSILQEGYDINNRHPSRSSSIVLEELIVQDEELARLHPASINAIRATAVRDRDGKIRLLHPWIKCGVNGDFIASAALNGFDALIDPETGVIISDGMSENGKIYQVHPNTNIRLKGFKIPKWDDLKDLIEELMNVIPQYGYVGWDMVLTHDGWVVMEANYSGEFMWQLMLHKGGKKEFEDIIGWKMDSDFWWQVRPFVVSEKSKM